jgi:hypothetical protein
VRGIVIALLLKKIKRGCGKYDKSLIAIVDKKEYWAESLQVIKNFL